MRGLRQEDFFPLLFLVPVAVLFPMLGRGADWSRFDLSFFAVLALAFLAVALAGGWLNRREGILPVASAIMRDLLPLVVLAFVYGNIGFLQADYALDARILAFNQYHLGFQDFELASAHGGTLAADFLALVYLAYIPIGIGYGFWLYDRRDNRAFRAYIAPMLMTHYLAFLGFVFVPVMGPKYFLPDLYPAHLHGDVVGPLNALVFESARSNTTDCFPSMHTALFAHACLAAWGWDRRSLPFLAVMTVLTMVSCVYLWYHYSVDVLAGLALPFATWWFVTALEPSLRRGRRRTGTQLLPASRLRDA